MFKILFDCSAFEISATVQAINDVLFPVFLFVIIFWFMCDIFLVDKELITDENIARQEDLQAESLLSNAEVNCKTELFDVDVEYQNLKDLGAGKLRQFCKRNKVKGYTTAYREGGIDGLVGFLIQLRIYVYNIEQQIGHVEISAIS
ncbi:hypothetical protein [Calothrix sp. CCY 0018]|uniref:hypothetical protein n=1 Tax=Calothrix sp. CCY 0018 TaxID=3103864 RepID=UPI0039C5E89D